MGQCLHSLNDRMFIDKNDETDSHIINMITAVPLEKASTLSFLRHFNITPTQQRLQIAQLLLSKAQHLSADDILAKLKPLVSKATVYNTLGLFVEKGLIKQVIVDPTKVFYDSNISNHHHFYNVDTGELIDIDTSNNLLLNQLPHLPAGTEATGIDIIIRICNK